MDCIFWALENCSQFPMWPQSFYCDLSKQFSTRSTKDIEGSVVGLRCLSRSRFLITCLVCYHKMWRDPPPPPQKKKKSGKKPPKLAKRKQHKTKGEVPCELGELRHALELKSPSSNSRFILTLFSPTRITFLHKKDNFNSEANRDWCYSALWSGSYQRQCMDTYFPHR